MAAEEGYSDIIECLLKKGDIKINVMNNCAICEAANNGHLNVVKLLVCGGADINANNNSPLSYAVEGNHTDIVKYSF